VAFCHAANNRGSTNFAISSALRVFLRSNSSATACTDGLHRYPIVFDQVSCADVCNSEPSVELLHGSGDVFQQIGSLQEIRVSAEPAPTVKLAFCNISGQVRYRPSLDACLGSCAVAQSGRSLSRAAIFA
jgi:hypothetical protein